MLHQIRTLSVKIFFQKHSVTIVLTLIAILVTSVIAIIVNNPPPPDAFIQKDSPPYYVGVPIKFTGADSTSNTKDGIIETYEWKFGDGTIKTGQDVTHTFQESNFYSISLTVTNNDKLSNTVKEEIEVKPNKPWSPFDVTVEKDVYYLGENAQITVYCPEEGNSPKFGWKISHNGIIQDEGDAVCQAETITKQIPAIEIGDYIYTVFKTEERNQISGEISWKVVAKPEPCIVNEIRVDGICITKPEKPISPQDPNIKPKFQFKFSLVDGTPTPRFEGISVDNNHNIYVSNGNGNTIQKFDSNGNLLKKWGIKGISYGEFNYPAYSAIDKDNNLYVVDRGNTRIQKFNSDGVVQAVFESPDFGKGSFTEPMGIAVDNTGNIFVSDTKNYKIIKLNSSGEFMLEFGSRGSNDGQFNDLRALAIDSENNLYVSDSVNHRIQKFTSEGIFLSKIGEKGREISQFSTPYGIAVDSRDYLYVADFENNRIQKFDSSGKPIWVLTENLRLPMSVAVDSSDRVYVTEKLDNNGFVFSQ